MEGSGGMGVKKYFFNRASYGVPTAISGGGGRPISLLGLNQYLIYFSVMNNLEIFGHNTLKTAYEM